MLALQSLEQVERDLTCLRNYQDGPQLASVVTGRALACKSSLSVAHRSALMFDLLYVRQVEVTVPLLAETLEISSGLAGPHNRKRPRPAVQSWSPPCWKWHRHSEYVLPSVLCCRSLLSVLKQVCFVRQPEQRCQMRPARQTLSTECLYYTCHLDGAPTSLWTSRYMPYLAEVCPALTYLTGELVLAWVSMCMSTLPSCASTQHLADYSLVPESDILSTCTPVMFAWPWSCHNADCLCTFCADSKQATSTHGDTESSTLLAQASVHLAGQAPVQAVQL